MLIGSLLTPSFNKIHSLISVALNSGITFLVRAVCFPSPHEENIDCVTGGLSNTVDMIRVDKVNCRVDFCISLRRLRNFVACLVGKRPRVMVVESYEPYVRVEKVFVHPTE